MDDKNGKVTILIVDDVKMNLKRAEIILKRALPCDIVLTESGRGCLQELLKRRADLVLLDYAMPELNGLETLRLMREYQRFQNIPVIFLTGSSDPLTIVKAMELKVDDYICKPFKVDDLVQRVTKALLKHGWQPPEQKTPEKKTAPAEKQS